MQNDRQYGADLLGTFLAPYLQQIDLFIGLSLLLWLAKIEQAAFDDIRLVVK